MSALIKHVSKQHLRELVSSRSGKDRQRFEECLSATHEAYVGAINNEAVCMWGLCPPTILSDRAYLWLYVFGNIEAHKFIFVRHSQRIIEDALKIYSTIYGVTERGNPSAVRWLRWLGASFGQTSQGLIPFTIRKTNG